MNTTTLDGLDRVQKDVEIVRPQQHVALTMQLKPVTSARLAAEASLAAKVDRAWNTPRIGGGRGTPQNQAEINVATQRSIV